MSDVDQKPKGAEKALGYAGAGTALAGAGFLLADLVRDLRGKGSSRKLELAGHGLGLAGAGLSATSAYKRRKRIEREQAMKKSAAFDAGVVHALEKESGLSELADKAKKALKKPFVKPPKAPFKPKFQGHQAAIQDAVGKGHSVSAKGVHTARRWDPATQSVRQSRYATI